MYLIVCLIHLYGLYKAEKKPFLNKKNVLMYSEISMSRCKSTQEKLNNNQP